ncbi:MAG: response regulator [Vicinamibacterales bacterium]|nr:response regulator [Vicinamibacterales bacterium]
MTDKTKVPQTLLLADDSVTIQRVIELTFADEAIKVVAVSDGDQAIARIEADPPDIVLVDIGMPGRTGYEVAQHIKQSPRLKHIPVLLLTGAFEPVDQAKAVAAGCDGVLAKPFEPQLVIARVKELLGRGGQGASSAAPAAESLEPSVPPGDNWAPSRAEPKGASPQSAQGARLDNYFDQLDAAFQTLGDRAPAEQPKGPAGASPASDIIDWFGGTPAPSGPPSDLPLSAAGPAEQPGREQTPDAGASPPPRFVSEPAPETAATAPAPPSTLPPIADAFAAILAAEQHEPMPALAPAWPTPPAAPSNSGGALSEDAIEEITRRVLDRLSDHVVRETVADVISSIAERLVREEIERIKSSIK